MDGFFLINKEKGITSNQLVQNKKIFEVTKSWSLGNTRPNGNWINGASS